MKRPIVTLLTTIPLLLNIAVAASAEGLPVGKYLEDPDHKNDIYGFYLSAVFTGINLVNDRIEPPLYCMDQSDPEPAFAMIDRRIKKMQAEKTLRNDTTIDSIMLDILIDEFPCSPPR